jgi:hypothetical protein
MKQLATKKKQLAPNRVELNDEPKTPEECAVFLRISKRALLDRTRKNKIPALRINQRVFRYHLPTVLAALGEIKDAA